MTRESATAEPANPTAGADIYERIVSRLRDVLAGEIDAADVTLDSTLREDLDLHSMDALSLIMDLEEEFDIELSDEEVAELSVIGDIVELVRTKCAPDAP